MKLLEQTRMAAIGAVQGFVLWLLRTRWPSAPDAAAVCLALAFWVVVSALVLHFVRTGGARARLLALAGSTGFVFAAVGPWVGWQLPPKDVLRGRRFARLVQGFEKALRAGDYRATEPRYRDLEIGGQRFRLWETRETRPQRITGASFPSARARVPRPRRGGPENRSHAVASAKES